LLAETFLDEFSQVHRPPRKRISREALRLLVSDDWPGNVRELRNVMERLMVTVQGDPIRPPHLPAGVQFEDSTSKAVTPPLGRPLREIELEVIRRALQEITSHRE